MRNKSSTPIRKKAAELFWEAIPPIWHTIHSELDRNAREIHEITGGHFHVLRLIKGGYTSVSELADARHISRPVVSRKVDSLVEKGLVSRRESPEDRRYTVLELTLEGDRILEELRASNREWLDERFRRLEEQEIEIVNQALIILKKLKD
jgi:DNA-binding MarR family transcriptional regulator